MRPCIRSKNCQSSLVACLLICVLRVCRHVIFFVIVFRSLKQVGINLCTRLPVPNYYMMTDRLSNLLRSVCRPRVVNMSNYLALTQSN